MTSDPSLDLLLEKIRACRLCQQHLPLPPRPIVRARPGARLLIVGQAPGTRVHDSGIPWNDPSGDRLRVWLGLGRDVFYDDRLIAIMPMGFCYPGVGKGGGDAPPRPECAPKWHHRLRAALPHIELTLLIGAYAQAYYLGDRRRRTMTDTVKCWREYLPDFIITPHPSWRNNGWLKRNPWFDGEVVPALRTRVRRLI